MGQRAVVVRVKWEQRKDPATGNRYAILRWTADGARHGLTLGYVSEAEAEAIRIRHEAALRLGVASPSDSSARPASVDDVLVLYLRELERRPVSAGYAELELQRCERLRLHLGHLAARSITADTLSRYLGDRRREASRFGTPPKRSSLTMEIDTLRRAFAAAARQRIIPRPEWGTVARIADDRRPHRQLTEAEVARLIAAAHRDLDGAHGSRPRQTEGLGWLLQVLAWSGRRPVAVLDLEVRHLERLDPDLPRSQQRVYWARDKGGVSRGWAPVTEPARAALVARAADVGEGRLWSLDTAKALHRPFHRVATSAGVEDVQVYDLRRHAVTRIVDACKGNLRTAMEFTGHRTTGTLLRYLYSDVNRAADLASEIGWSKPRTVAPVGTGSRGGSDGRDP